MPRVCTVCTHPKRAEIDKELASGAAIKQRIATALGLTDTALGRHERRHLAPALIVAHERSQAALRDSDVRTARQNAIDCLSDLRQMREAFVTNGRLIPHQDLLQIIDRVIKANEQYGRITKEIGADQVNQVYIDLGVRNEAEARSRIEASRSGEELSVEQMVEETLNVQRMLVHKDPETWYTIRDAVERMSRAVEVTNGANGHGLLGLPEGPAS